MTSNRAWQRHGCYQLGSQQYFNMPLEKSLLGCQDDWNSLDHFDPTASTRLMFTQFNRLRTLYGSLQDGLNLVQRGNWTYFIQRPGSNGTQTEMGLWSVSRSAIGGYQTVGGAVTDQVWMLFTNENTTQTYTFNCTGALWISSPYVSGTTLRNLLPPYENYTLMDSLSSFNNDSKPPYFGCLPTVTMSSYGFKALVPVAEWMQPQPFITQFTPGHDYRLLSGPGGANATVDIAFEFNVAMNCDAVTSSVSLNMSSSGQNVTPTIANVQCNTISSSANASSILASTWSWSGTLTNLPDGVLTITVNNPLSASGNGTGVCRIFTRVNCAIDICVYRVLIISYSEKGHQTMWWFSLKMITIPADRSCSRITHIPIPTPPLGPTYSGTQEISGKLGRSGLIGKTPPY
jgi:alpha-1,3-glucan synthase